MSQALDTELGRLLDTMDPAVLARTVVFVVGDNGSPSYVIEPPFPTNRAKASTFEGGVRIPFYVMGPVVTQPGSVSQALVHIVDIFPTVAELAGIDLASAPAPLGQTSIDGVSLLSAIADPSSPGERQYLFSDGRRPNGAPPYDFETYTLRDERWKIRYHPNSGFQLFEIVPGAMDEGPPLDLATLTMEQQAAYDRLYAELQATLQAVAYGSP